MEARHPKAVLQALPSPLLTAMRHWQWVKGVGVISLVLSSITCDVEEKESRNRCVL